MNTSSLKVAVVSEGIKEASNSFSGLSTSAKNAERNVLAFVAAMEKLEAISRMASTQLQAFNAKLQAQLATLQQLNAATTSSASATQALAAAMAALSNTVLLLVNNSNAARNAQHAHNASMAEAHALARGLSGSLGALWVTYGNLAGMATGLAIGLSLKGIVSVGKDVESTAL